MTGSTGILKVTGEPVEEPAAMTWTIPRSRDTLQYIVLRILFGHQTLEVP